LKRALVNACLATLLVAQGNACTFYTSCPDGTPPPPAQTGGTGNGGSSSGGSSGVIPGDEDKAKPWVAVTSNLEGMESECGNLGYVSVKPDEDAVIAAVARRGLFVSRDGDPEWVPMGEAEGSEALDNRTSQLTYDPDEPSVFWQSGAYGPCTYRTDDNGDSFQHLGDVMHCDSISVDFTDPERKTLLAGGHEGHDLFKSSDAGETWENIVSALPEDSGNTGFTTILDTQTYLVASWRGETAGVYRTTDGGDNWSQVWEGGVRSRPLLASDSSIYWVLSNEDGNQGLIRSEDGGESFAKVEGSDGILSVETALVELPDQRLVTVGFTHLVISDDGGKTWREIGKTLPFTPWGVTYSPVRKLFYVWHFDCVEGSNPVSADAIMSLEFDYESE
jgi:photosystem II stability/assembly factor-like uncharacterized protein